MNNNKITFKRKLKGAIQLFRLELSFAAGLCVIVGEVIALGGFPPFRSLFYGFTCGFFISSSALILNDYFDIEVDKINAPSRPLPSGIISPLEVIVLTIAVTFLGLAAANAMGLYALTISIILWIIGVLYNWKLKETGLPGNLMVSLSVAATFILGEIAAKVQQSKVILIFSIIAFLINLGEEIAADAVDIEGDKKRNSKSIAIKFGRKTALRISFALFSLVILMSFMPIFFNLLGISYLILISICDIIIFGSAFKLLRSRTPEEGLFCIKQIYRGALLGLLAYIINKLFFFI